MPEISLLEPRVLNGVVSHFLEDIEPELLGLNLIGAGVPDLNPTWEYDIMRGNRDQSSPNAPNGEARRIDHIKYGTLTGSYVYLRDKKQFTPTTLRWLREPGTNAAAGRMAQAQVLRELRDMSNRQLRYMEATIWAMFAGTLTYTHEGGGTVSVDFGIQSSHKPTVSTAWGQSGDDPIGDISAWKLLTEEDAGVEMTTAYMNTNTWNKFMKLSEVRAQLSDEQKGQITRENRLNRFNGLNWIEYHKGYVPVGGSFTPYIPDDKIVLVAPGNDPWQLKLGPCADHDAPLGQTGSFSKSWREPDPSAQQFLIERTFMPCLFRPDQVVYASIA